MDNLELYMEASLTDSVLYKTFNNNAELTSLLLKAMKDSIMIDSSYIQEQLLQMERTKISPILESVMSSYENGDIIILYSKVKKLPQVIPFFATKISGKVKVVVFVNNFSTINTNATDSSKKYLNISMKDLYVLLEGAYTLLKYSITPIMITKNLGLMKVTTNIYTNMIMRIMNKEYAVSMDQDLYDKVAFSISYFYLNKIWGSKNRDVNISYAFNVIKSNKTASTNNIQLLLDEYESKDINDIQDLITFISLLSPRLKSLNFRYFIQCYINLYKPTSLFGLEFLPFFLFTIESSMVGSFIVNQPIINDITKNIKGMNLFYPELTKAIL